MSGKSSSTESWAHGNSYEAYMGRWSRVVAKEFIAWLALPREGEWLDAGCGTGALSQTILGTAIPQKVIGIDRSYEFVQHARQQVTDQRAKFGIGDAQSLPVKDGAFDTAVAGLVLNFVPNPSQMVSEMKRAVRRGGTVALYVWDYAGGMQIMRHFWNAAATLDPAAAKLDQGERFPICKPDPLNELFRQIGLSPVEVYPIDIETSFVDFVDYWSPFLGGQGSAPGYAMSLGEDQRARLRQQIFNSLPFAPDGSISLVARAWAVKGVRSSLAGHWEG